MRGRWQCAICAIAPFLKHETQSDCTEYSTTEQILAAWFSATILLFVIAVFLLPEWGSFLQHLSTHAPSASAVAMSLTCVTSYHPGDSTPCSFHATIRSLSFGKHFILIWVFVFAGVMKLVMEPQKQHFTLDYVQFNLDIKYMFPGKRRTLNNYMLSKLHAQ